MDDKPKKSFSGLVSHVINYFAKLQKLVDGETSEKDSIHIQSDSVRLSQVFGIMI